MNNFLAGITDQTKITIHWDYILITIGAVLLIRVFVGIIRVRYNFGSIKKSIDNKDYDKALSVAVRFEKELKRNHSVSADSLRITIAILYLFSENKSVCRNYLDVVINSELLMSKFFWKALIALSENEQESFAQYRLSFNGAPRPENVELPDYDTLNNYLTVIQRYCEDKNEETFARMNSLIENDDSLRGNAIAKLFGISERVNKKI